MNKKIKILIFFAACVAILHLFPGGKKALYDIISGHKPDGFVLVWPFTRVIFEPFVAFCEYLLSIVYYGPQLLSWVLWIFIFCLGYGIKERQKFAGIGALFLRYLLIFISFVTAVLIVPLPVPRLNAPSNFTKIDFHSHTYFSYDAIDSPKSNLRFHDRLGFDLFFATEQQNTNSLDHFDKKARLSKVFPGVQVRTKDGNALLVLGEKYFDGREFAKKRNHEIIALAHSKNLLVICPHWWKWRTPSIEEIYKAGVDGFEVYNPGYMQLAETERQSIISFCEGKNLLMTSATDWHGWGAFSDVWTVVEEKPDRVKAHPVQYLKTRPKTMVLVNSRNESQKKIRYYLEPFFAIYYYFSTLGVWECLSWLVWVLLLILLFSWKRIFFGIISAAFFAGAAYYLGIAFSIKDNETILPLVVPALFLIGLGWLIAAILPARKKT